MKKKRIRCIEVVRHVCDNLDEGLNSPRCREIRRHLQKCPNCTAYLDSLKKTVYLFRHEMSRTKPLKTRMELTKKLRSEM